MIGESRQVNREDVSNDSRDFQIVGKIRSVVVGHCGFGSLIISVMFKWSSSRLNSTK